MKTVFVFLKNSLFLSDMLQTNYIRYLAEKYRVVVFHNIIGDSKEAENRYFTSPNIIYIPWQTQNKTAFRIFKFLRTNCLHELDNLSSMKIYYKSPMFLKDKRARLARFLSWPFAWLATVDFFTNLERFFTLNTKLFRYHFKKYQPAAVITATPGIQVFDAEAIILAKKFGVPSIATNFSWDNLIGFKAARLRKPDYLFVWNEIIRDAAVKIHRISSHRIFVTGSMRFDRYFDSSYELPSREEFLSSKGLDPAKQTLLFATVGTSYESTLIQILLNWRDRAKIPYVNFLIRPHPFDRPERYAYFGGQKNVCVDSAGKVIQGKSGRKEIAIDREAFINLKSTLLYTDINVNYKSTISLESFLFDKPVINFVNPSRPMHNQIYFDKDSYYYPVVAYGAARLTKNEDELRETINEYLAHPEKNQQARKEAARLFFAFTDGLSYQRNVDFLKKIIDSNN